VETEQKVSKDAVPLVLHIDDWPAWWNAVTPQGALVELLALALCGTLAWGVAVALRRWRVRRAVPPKPPAADAAAPAQADAHKGGLLGHLGHRGLPYMLFPLLWLLLAGVARMVILRWQPVPVLRVALPLLIALAVIRVAVTVLRAAFAGAATRPLERVIFWGGWVAAALWVSGALPRALELLDGVTWHIGSAHISIRALIQGVLTAGALMLLALWVSALIEARLLLKAKGAALSVRKAIATAVRAFMVFVGLLLGLSAVGIDLTALSVLGGAIGVGIGLGLQKLAANYISGFVLLAERSVRIGDLIRVDGFEGRVADIRTRFTIIRSIGGIEAIVPNETLTTSKVENLSLSDARLQQNTTVAVGYGSDTDLVQRLLIEAALECPRVLQDPRPSALLSGFGADRLEFTLVYWLADPENGMGGPRSQINLAILRLLRAHGVALPYPRRVVQVEGADAGADANLAAPGMVGRQGNL